jgi:hexulose-6-phosphate isomerase
MITPIGIMQGRPSLPVGDRIQCFPQESWRDEFPRAAQAGLDAIEWIFDLDDAAMNPLATDTGIAEMHKLCREHGVAVRSICADYFMARTLVRASREERAERLAKLDWLLGRCGDCGITRMVLPFVDASKIVTAADRDDVVSALEHALPTMERTDVEIHLETSLPPVEFRELLDRVPHAMVRVNYDSGNSSSLGFEPRAEWDAYGDRIGSVHIKDRILGGSTVLLGTGNADFPALFSAVRRAGYSGPWVLQAARGTPGDEVAWAKKNRAFVVERLERGT